MNKMVVAIDYTSTGSRTIAQIDFNIYTQSETALTSYARVLERAHDEVYIVDFDPNSQDFIHAIVNNGCRI